MDHATLTIGQLAERFGLKTSAIRYYERVGVLQTLDVCGLFADDGEHGMPPDDSFALGVTHVSGVPS